MDVGVGLGVGVGVYVCVISFFCVQNTRHAGVP